jgi:3-oxoacyl-[acyl-carrier-protein] synthase III
MQFIAGQAAETYDEEGVLAVRMFYPHSGRRAPGQSMVELSDAGPNHLRVAGLMHEPAGDTCLDMAGMMGMVKLFVRSGVKVVAEVMQSYRQRMATLGTPEKGIAAAIVHHANLKINQLKQKHLLREGLNFPMPWLLREFGNVSAASNVIAFLRYLPKLRPGDHVLFDGFGAGTYYDVVVVALRG